MENLGNCAGLLDCRALFLDYIVNSALRAPSTDGQWHAWSCQRFTVFYHVAQLNKRRPLAVRSRTRDPPTIDILTPQTRHVPRSQKDPGSWIPRIQDPRYWSILDLIFSFSLVILEILYPATPTLLWDPRDPGSWTEKILLDPGDPGSSLRALSRDLADLGSHTTICLCIFWRSLTYNVIFFLFPISISRLNLSTVNVFSHVFNQPFRWLENKFTLLVPPHLFYYRGVVTRMW